jgi:hypothetical protein
MKAIENKGPERICIKDLTISELSYEFCWMLLKEFSKKLPDKNLKLSNIKFPFRDEIDVFNFSNRGAAVGINTLLIVLNP